MKERDGDARFTLRLNFATSECKVERWMKLSDNLPNVDKELFIESQREFVTIRKVLIWSLGMNSSGASASGV